MRLSDIAESKTLRAALLALLTATLVGACAPASKKRTPGTVIDDQTVQIKALNNIYRTAEFDRADHVKVEVHNGTVLLAGETKSEANKDLATRVVNEIRGVKHIVNELAVMPAAGLGERLDNSYISAKANSILTARDPIGGVDMARIKVITARRNVYLMGTVTQKEGEAVAEVVRNIGGVEKVVKVFDYLD